MIKNLTVLIAACILLCVLAGCDLISDLMPSSAEEDPQSSADYPPVDYDARTQTLSVQTTQEFSGLQFPEEIKQARVLKVSGDMLELSVYLPILRKDDWDEQTELPGLLERTEQSLRFLRQYLRGNAGEAYPDALAARPVAIQIDSGSVGYQTEEERISLRYIDAGTHRDFLYLLALQNNDRVGWEQIGYAWYAGTCIDPYSEMADAIPLVPELPYYPQYIAGGIDPAHTSASDFRIVYDACSRVALDKGLTGWGSTCESLPVSKEPVFTRTDAKQEGDAMLSAFMAASFLAWLDETSGFEQLSLFCFGQNSFEESFGTDFQTAFDQWRSRIEQNYPAV